MNYTAKHSLGSIVTFRLGDHKIRWCSVTAIKFEEPGCRYDLLVQGNKVYDVLESQIEGIEEEADSINKGELN